jgi:hypothetical protein
VGPAIKTTSRVSNLRGGVAERSSLDAAVGGQKVVSSAAARVLLDNDPRHLNRGI